MRKTFLTAVIVLAACAPLSAQSFLKGLKEAVTNEISRNIADTKDAVNSAKESITGDRSSKNKYGVVKPSTARNAAELLNELPDFPSAAQIAENDDSFRNHFYDQIYAVENRMDELMNANRANQDEDDERVQANMLKLMTGTTGSLEEMMKSFDIEAIQKAAQSNDINALMALSEKAVKMSESMSAARPSVSADMYTLENDRDFADFITKLAEIAPVMETVDAGKAKESETLAAINSGFEKIWSEKDEAALKRLYADVNSKIEDFELICAQARIDQNARLKGQYASLISDAEKIAAAYSPESLVARYDMLNLPFGVVAAYKELLYDVWGSNDDINASDAVVPVQRIRINLPLQDGDEIYRAESSIYQMLDDQALTSVYGLAKSTENVEEEFLSKAVFLVKNSRDGKFYKIQGGSRTPLGSEYEKSFDFSQRYMSKERADAKIRMKSLEGKALTFNKNHTLFIPIPNSGSYFDVLAIQRTEEWVAFITMDSKGDLYKCLFRL